VSIEGSPPSTPSLFAAHPVFAHERDGCAVAQPCRRAALPFALAPPECNRSTLARSPRYGCTDACVNVGR
jgi:hypothetical protein